MMSAFILLLAGMIYAASAAVYVRSLLGRATSTSPKAGAGTGEALLFAAFCTQAVAIGVGCAESAGRDLISLSGGVALIGWLGAAACLLVQRVARMPQLGAFVVPLLAAMVAPAALGGPRRSELRVEHLREPALQLHVLAAALAVALFALAAGVAAMYLLQQRQLKAKRFGRLFSSLPSLEPLTRLNGRLLWAGFFAYGVAFLTGAATADAIWPSGWSWDAQQVASLAILAVYGLLAIALPRAGRPRRRAVATVGAFLVTVGAMALLRAVPSATRHLGDYGMAGAVSESREHPGHSASGRGPAGKEQ
jgi:ABC-type uncharacterized transport system permease subunit